MTGAEIHAQVRRALLAANKYLPGQTSAALAALDGCVLLTAEEAAKVREYVAYWGKDWGNIWPGEVTQLLALLTPKEASDD